MQIVNFQRSSKRSRGVRKTVLHSTPLQLITFSILTICAIIPRETKIKSYIFFNFPFDRVKSHVDGKDMDGILSMKMNNGGTDFITGKHVIRWTEVFILPTKDERSDEDPARFAE